MGLISFVGNEERMIGSQFFITLGEELTYLDEKHCVFGEVVEGLDILDVINEVICDTDDRPYQDVRITHTVVLDDPYPDPKHLEVRLDYLYVHNNYCYSIGNNIKHNNFKMRQGCVSKANTLLINTFLINLMLF
nr:unnamed protein product [Callosobruchus analis]